MNAIKTIVTWAALTAASIALGYMFFGWGLDQLERMEQYKPPWSKPGYHEHAYQLDFAEGRTKTSGHGYYDRRRERGR